MLSCVIIWLAWQENRVVSRAAPRHLFVPFAYLFIASIVASCISSDFPTIQLMSKISFPPYFSHSPGTVNNSFLPVHAIILKESTESFWFCDDKAVICPSYC